MKKRRIAVFVLMLLMSLFASFPVYASTVPSPDSPGLDIVWYNAYENTNVSGDVLVLVEYRIPYATLPAASANINYLIRYLHSGTVLQSKAPFAYNQSGYNYGAAAFYWTPGDPGIPTWGESNDSIQLTGNPTVGWGVGTITTYTGIVSGSPVTLISGSNTVNIVTTGTVTVTLPAGSSGTAASGTATLTGSPVTLTSDGSTTLDVSTTGTITLSLTASFVPTTSVTMQSANWISSTSIAQGRQQICDAIASDIAVDLQSKWGLTLLTQSANGTVLNATNGQVYFSNVLPYFTTICSTLLTSTGPQPVQTPYVPTGGTASDGITGVIIGSPIALSNGTNTVTVLSAGDLTIVVPVAQTGTVLSGTASLQNSPVTLTAGGTTTITATSVGTLTIILHGPYAQTYGESLQAIWPSATTTLSDGSVLGIGASIQNASSSMGMTTDEYLFVLFMIIMSFVMAVTAAALGGPQFIPLLFIPIFIGCIKVGVVPMNLGVGICAVLFIISMFFLIHRRAAV